MDLGQSRRGAIQKPSWTLSVNTLRVNASLVRTTREATQGLHFSRFLIRNHSLAAPRTRTVYTLGMSMLKSNPPNLPTHR